MIRNITRCLHNATFKEKYNNLIINNLKKIKIDDIKQSLVVRNENVEINDLCELLQNVHNGNYYEIFSMINNLPNLVSPTTPVGKEKDSIITKLVKTNENKFSKHAQIIGKDLCQLRINDVNAGAESRAYYLNGHFAMLERALIRYTLEILMKNGFQLISVPDIINKNIVQKSGFKIDPFKNQIYNVVTNPDELTSIFKQNELNTSCPNECLAGTSEMALATYLSNSVLKKQNFPIKLCAVSRCYRREVSGLESHLYRVHQFNKVEMFCATSQSESEKMLDYIVDIQTKIIAPLGLEFRILDMASEELGYPAFKKYDIEVWMPGDKIYGEISSASNCTDYQARTMNIFYENENDDLDFAHTLNGTGCAVPRLLKSILETHHTENGHVVVPEVLRKYMKDICKITRQHPPLKVNWIKKL